MPGIGTTERQRVVWTCAVFHVLGESGRSPCTHSVVYIECSGSLESVFSRRNKACLNWNDQRQVEVDAIIVRDESVACNECTDS